MKLKNDFLHDINLLKNLKRTTQTGMKGKNNKLGKESLIISREREKH